MLIQFKNGPKSAIQTQSFLTGEPAFANDTKELFVGDGFTLGGINISSLGGSATYIIQDEVPPAPANPTTAKSFWYDTSDSFLYIWKYAGGVGAWTRVLASGATGPTGASGAIGSIGAQGIQGIQGVRGATFLSGSTGPISTTTAIDGDYFLNTTTRLLYGPRVTTSGVVSWGGAIDLKGETGEQGIQGVSGAVGAVGPDGTKIFYGNEVPTSTFPSSTERREGDFYIDLVAGRLYGGYTTSQGWGAGVSLLGPAGSAGAQGSKGDAGTAGLVWRGVWASGSTYPEKSVVQHSGSSYVSLKATTNNPTIVTDWDLVASKGGSTSATAVIYATSPIVWDEPTTTLSFNVPNAATGNVLKYDGTAWVAGTSVAAKSIYSGAGAPASGTGSDGDFYMQMAGTGAPILFGPKSGTDWGSGVSLIGANGTNGQNGIAGPAGADGTAGMEWNGTWSATVNYSEGAVVEYLGSLYICEVDNTLNITPNTTFNWDLLVAKGEQGETANIVGTLPITMTSVTTGVFPNESTTLTVSLADGTTTGDVLTWNSVNKSWSGEAPNELLDGLADVTITSVASGEVLKYSGTEWVNGEITLESLSDVVITTIETGDVLSFDGTNWVNSTTVSSINAVLPLEWDSETSTIKIGDGSKDDQAILWNVDTLAWEIKDLPAADITANAPLFWNSTDKVLSFGVDAQSGNVLMYDGVAWVASTPYDHSRPTILWGDGVPPQGLGRSGDFYIDTTGHYLYGPKCSGCLNNKWTSIQEPVSLIGPTGATGPAGIQGVQGVQGPTGTTGAQGNSTQNLIRKVDHSGDPSTMPPYTNYNYIGNNGDFLIVNGVTTIRWYGPKAAGVWPTPYIELKGTEGPQGVQGIQGIAGPQAGQIIHSATVASNASIPPDPSATLGDVGDFQITQLNTTTGEYIGSYLFGPKTSSATDPWGTPRNLRGPTGPTGSTGAQGIAGSSDPTLADIDGGLFNTGTTENPTLAIKTVSGTGLVLKNIGTATHPHLSLDLASLGVFYLNSLNQISLRPISNNASQRRSFFGI
jgi:hypothetical protein